jgi:hypothetical protein
MYTCETHNTILKQDNLHHFQIYNIFKPYIQVESFQLVTKRVDNDTFCSQITMFQYTFKVLVTLPLGGLFRVIKCNSPMAILNLSYIQNLKFLWKIILYLFQQKQVVKILNDIINIQRYDYKGVALNFDEINNMVTKKFAKFFEQ